MMGLSPIILNTRQFNLNLKNMPKFSLKCRTILQENDKLSLSGDFAKAQSWEDTTFLFIRDRFLQNKKLNFCSIFTIGLQLFILLIKYIFAFFCLDTVVAERYLGSPNDTLNFARYEVILLFFGTVPRA
jgi:hypothetical protein